MGKRKHHGYRRYVCNACNLPHPCEYDVVDIAVNAPVACLYEEGVPAKWALVDKGISAPEYQRYFCNECIPNDLPCAVKSEVCANRPIRCPVTGPVAPAWKTCKEYLAVDPKEEI